MATAILDILSGAQAGDALVIANKVAVGNYYVAQTFNHHVSMTPASARQALDGIDYSAASARAAQAEIDTFIAAVEQARLSPKASRPSASNHRQRIPDARLTWLELWRLISPFPRVALVAGAAGLSLTRAFSAAAA